jgi:hypothetical protein
MPFFAIKNERMKKIYCDTRKFIIANALFQQKKHFHLWKTFVGNLKFNVEVNLCKIIKML